jgi:PAS domain S-box-containing protein
MRRELDAVREGDERLAEKVTALDARAQGLRAELGAGRERLDALGAEIERMGEGIAEAHETAASARSAVDEEASALRSELGAVRTVADTTGEALAALRAEFDAVRAQAAAMESVADDARAATKAGEERIVAMQAEVTFALKSIEDLKQGLTSAGQAAVIARREAGEAKKAALGLGDGGGGGADQMSAVLHQLLGMAGGRERTRRPSQIRQAVKPEEVKPREPRHGFDDATQPMAMLNLEGQFRELNPAFARLVGYQESDFQKAAWPSPHDRRDYQEQQDQLRQLAAGEVECVTVQSTYMHGQGLMVPVVGKLTAVPGEDGLPLHLLLEAEERHTN